MQESTANHGKSSSSATIRASAVDLQQQQQQVEYHWRGALVEEQQAPSPPTFVLPLKLTASAAIKTSPAATTTTTATATLAANSSVELSPSSQPSDEEREADSNNMPPTATVAAAASPHPWRRDLAFKHNVNNNKRTPKQDIGLGSSGSSSSSERYRTSYRTLLQQRKQVFGNITIQEESGEQGEQQRNSIPLDEENENDSENEECYDVTLQQNQHPPPSSATQYDDLHIPPLLTSRNSLGGAAVARIPTFSNTTTRSNNNFRDDSDAVSLGMSIQSSVNRNVQQNAIRTLLQQEIKVRVQQIYTGDFYCVVGMSEEDGQYRKKPTFGRHGRPLDHPIFSPRFVRLQEELQQRLQSVYTANHYVIEAMGGMTPAKQTEMAHAVHQQALSQVNTEFNEKLKSLRSNRQLLASGAGLSCWDEENDDDNDSDNDDCSRSTDGHPDDEQHDDECPLDEQQQDGRPGRVHTNKDIVLENNNLDPTNSMTDEDDEVDNVFVTEYSTTLVQGKQLQQQHQQVQDDSEWDEYTIATTAMEDVSLSRSVRNESQPSFLKMTKSRMFSDFQVDPPEKVPQQKAVDDDEYTEYTVQSSVPETASAGVRGGAIPSTIGGAATNSNNKNNDDNDEWDEYTVQSTVAGGSVAQQVPPSKAILQEQARMMGSRMFTDFNPNNMNKNTSRQVVLPPTQKQQADDADEWDEYTIQDSVAAPPSGVVVVEEAQAAARQRQLQLLNRSRYAREQAAAAKAAREGGSISPRTSPRSLSIHKQSSSAAAVSAAVVSSSRQEHDNDEWEEYTIQDETVQSSSTRPSSRPISLCRGTLFSNKPLSSSSPSNPIIVTSNNNSNKSHDNAKTSRLASGAALPSTPPQPRAGPVDLDEEWEEYTIQESVVAKNMNYSLPAPLVDTSAFGHSRMFSSFDPKSSSNDNHQSEVVDDDISDNDDDDEASMEQYIHCPGDASVVSAFTMEPGWHQHEEANRRNRLNQFNSACAPPKSPKSTSQGGTQTAPTCDASSADSSNHHNNNKATTTTRSVVSTSQYSATSAGGGSSCTGGGSGTAGSKRIAELLRRDIWSKNEKVVHKAMLELLQDAALGGPESCARIVRYGGPLAIMCAMEANPNHVDIQIAACGTMEQLAAAGNNIDVVNNNNGRGDGEQPPPPSDHRVTLGEVGAVQSIVTAMKADMDHVELQRVACSALVNLTHHGALNDITLDGAVEAVTRALTRHTSDPTIQETAFVALGNLCMENMTRLQELSEVDGLAAMTTALQRPWKNPTEKQGAISTLSMLLRAQAECC